MSKIAFDIGANVGKTTESLIKLYDHVICVEPIKSHCDLLRNKFHSKNVTVVNSLVSSKKETKLFFECDTISTVEKRWIENSRFSKSYFWKDPIEMESTTLDLLIHEYGVPNFIKIDVEGHELDVIEGLTENFPSFISFEWAEELFDKTKSCIDLLQKKGYNNFYVQNFHDEIIDVSTIKWLNKHDAINTIMKSENGQTNWGMIWAKRSS